MGATGKSNLLELIENDQSPRLWDKTEPPSLVRWGNYSTGVLNCNAARLEVSWFSLERCRASVREKWNREGRNARKVFCFFFAFPRHRTAGAVWRAWRLP